MYATALGFQILGSDKKKKKKENHFEIESKGQSLWDLPLERKALLLKTQVDLVCY